MPDSKKPEILDTANDDEPDEGVDLPPDLPKKMTKDVGASAAAEQNAEATENAEGTELDPQTVLAARLWNDLQGIRNTENLGIPKGDAKDSADLGIALSDGLDELKGMAKKMQGALEEAFHLTPEQSAVASAVEEMVQLAEKTDPDKPESTISGGNDIVDPLG